MSRTLTFSLLTVAALSATGPALANDAYTTRIETRPFYGAIVTMEQGVRVFRPLPPTRQLIINPGGQTPLNIGQTDVNVTDPGYYYGGHHHR